MPQFDNQVCGVSAEGNEVEMPIPSVESLTRARILLEQWVDAQKWGIGRPNLLERIAIEFDAIGRGS